MPTLENTANFVRKIIEFAIRTSANIGITMLDREFFSTEVMTEIGRMKIGYLIPCKNTDIVVDALCEFEKGRRSPIFESIITGGSGNMPTSYGTSNIRTVTIIRF